MSKETKAETLEIQNQILDQVLTNLKGESLKKPTPTTAGPDYQEEFMSLREVCKISVLAARKEDTGQRKYEKFQTATKLINNELLSAEEIVLLRDEIDKSFSQPIVAGQAWTQLDRIKMLLI